MSIMADNISCERTPPLVLPASKPPEDHSKSAAFVFIHGLGDDAIGIESWSNVLDIAKAPTV